MKYFFLVFTFDTSISCKEEKIIHFKIQASWNRNILRSIDN
jgi:hypothetical protein